MGRKANRLTRWEDSHSTGPSSGGTRRMPRPAAILLPLLLLLPPSVEVRAAERESPSTRWEDEIRRIEARDRQSPPPHGGILFVGSSSIRRWDLKADFPDLPVVNHGFGGSQIADSVYYADRIILPLKPRVVVVYAGDNDIQAGKSPRQVRDDFRQLTRRIHQKLPKTRVVFIAIKPSLKRWNLVDRMKEANRLIRAEIEQDERLEYADIFAPMLGEDGRPREALFASDGLHLSRAGYASWAERVRPLIVGEDPARSSGPVRK